MIDAEQIKQFCTDLQISLLGALGDGIPITFSRDVDTEAEHGDMYGAIPVVVYHGTTLTIKIGRPALLARLADERDRAALLARLGK